MIPSYFHPKELLNPVGWDAFLEATWEKEHLFIPSRGVGYYDSLFRHQDVDALIPLAVGERGVRLAQDGEKSVVPNDAAALYQAYQAGSTVVINRLHRLWRPVNLFCLSLGELLNHPAGVNLYLTPPGSTGFGVHYDTHDVFILQIAGRKLWDLYGMQFELPLEGQKVPLAENLGPPEHTLELGPGSLLYMPRGLAHQARTPNDSFSLHLTLGIHVLRWGDLIVQALDLARHEQVDFRRSLPAGFLKRSPQLLEGPFRELLVKLQETADHGVAVSSLAEVLFDRAPSPIDHHFMDLEQLSSLNEATLLQKRTGTLYYFYEEGEQLVLRFCEGTVVVPKRIRKAIEFILKSEWFSVASIPQLDTAGRLTLVRRLIKEGLLTTVE
jgi:ribosomal protein L16 Arg81 hydroxylase